MTEYGSPLPPAPQPPVPPKRKSHTALIVVLSVVGAIVLMCVAGTALIAAGGGTKPAAHVAASSSPASMPTVTTDPTSASPDPTTQAPAKTLVSQSGNGEGRTAAFTTGDSWAIAYHFDCTNFGSQGNFAITVYDSASGMMEDLPVNSLKESGDGTVPEYATPGTHYLSILSECDWTITVVG